MARALQGHATASLHGRLTLNPLIPAKAGTQEKLKTFNTKEEKDTKHTKGRYAPGQSLRPLTV